MRTYTERKKTITEKVLKRIVCDRCGRDITSHAEGKFPDSPEPINTFRFELKTEWGTGYPEGGSGEGYTVDDLCVPCALDLRAVLRAAGFTVRDTEWDF